MSIDKLIETKLPISNLGGAIASSEKNLNSRAPKKLQATSNSSVGNKSEQIAYEDIRSKMKLVKPRSLISCDLLNLSVVGQRVRQKQGNKVRLFFKNSMKYLVGCGNR